MTGVLWVFVALLCAASGGKVHEKEAAAAATKAALARFFDFELNELIENKTGRSISRVFPFLLSNETINKVEILAKFEKQLELNNQIKGRNCLKNLTDCMLTEPEYESTMKHLTNFLLRTSPPFDLSNVEGVSEECRAASLRYITDLKSYKMWALGMYDATAKLPSGLLSGNVNQLGDFDLCRWTKIPQEEQSKIYGKYCLAALQIETPHNAYLSTLHNRLYAHQSFKSKLGDPGHRVPRFSSINWGLCVPSQCSSNDVELGFRKSVDTILGETDLDYVLEVDAEMCTSFAPKNEINYSFFIVSGFFVLIAIWTLLSTLYDFLTEEKLHNDFLVAFSLKKNILSMINIKSNEKSNDLEAVHGIRFINALMLLLSHKSMALLFLPYVNRTEMSETISQPWTVIGRAASLYTDPFLMLSATLTTYSIVGKLQRNQKISIVEEYLSRLFRLVPTLGALILFCTFVLPFLSSGPMWNLVVSHHAVICKQNWWRNLLFIHNYFGFKDMCLTHTHHVGIDTQLFFLSPFLILLVWKWPKRGSFLLVVLATVATFARYHTTYSRELSNYIHFGTSIDQLFNTADYMYTLPPHRITVYIMGIFLGFLLRNCKNLILKPAHIHLGNLVAILSFLASFIGPAFMGSINYVYQPVHAAWYAAFAPICWCFAFAWIIFTTHLGYKSLVGQLFSIPYFKIWTKISYTVYLTQFPIFFFNVGTQRHADHYQFIQKNVNVLEMGVIFATSIIMTLLFETPFINIKNALFFKKRRAVEKNVEPLKEKSN